jgi:site-specific DNA-methyltransferase (adenine-specific)
MVALQREQANSAEVIHGDCLQVLRTMADCSVDAVIGDPPAGISFMGRDWDNPNTWALEARSGKRQDGGASFGSGVRINPGKKERDAFIAFMTEVARECLRVLKPGGNCLMWALPRTSHWTATALEDAGMEVRDCLYHIQGQGFPKALDVSKAIDKHLQAEREVIGEYKYASRKGGKVINAYMADWGDRTQHKETAPATPEAQQWSGWHSALKPSVEMWWLCRKPLDGTIAENCLKWGVGALNIDACRVKWQPGDMEGQERYSPRISPNPMDWGKGKIVPRDYKPDNQGRYPSHLLLSHTLFCTDEQCEPQCPVAILDAQSGIKVSKWGKTKDIQQLLVKQNTYGTPSRPNPEHSLEMANRFVGDQGGCSRYFTQLTPDIPFLYTPKASRRERNAGCEELPEQEHGVMDIRPSGDFHTRLDGKPTQPRANNHPTVKPLSLMKWLVSLACPPGGLVLDPFCGSGSTGVACVYEGMRFIGVEQDESYVQIARARIEHALKEVSR